MPGRRNQLLQGRERGMERAYFRPLVARRGLEDDLRLDSIWTRLLAVPRADLGRWGAERGDRTRLRKGGGF